MISLESRRKEVEVAKRLWHRRISHNVSIVNDHLEYDVRYIFLLKRIQGFAARKNLAEYSELWPRLYRPKKRLQIKSSQMENI